MRWRWSGDCDRVLANLPAPLFRHGDIFTAADTIGIERWQGQAIWHQLRLSGRIVRTRHLIGRSRGKRCYWTRSHCSIRITPDNGPLLRAMAGPRLVALDG